jgi:HTH-type transcriptional regulator/antitoxin HigA
MTTATRKRSAKGDEYLDLVMRFPPRPIRSGRQYDETVAVMDELAVRDESALTDAESDYLEALTRFVEDYEAAQEPARRSKRSPTAILKFLLEQNDMSASDLGRLLGSRTLGSKILRGERELSKAHIRILADRFAVNPGLFL